MQRYESSSTPLEENMRCAWTEHKQRVYQQRCLQQFDFLHQKYIELKGARMIDVDHVDVTVAVIVTWLGNSFLPVDRGVGKPQGADGESKVERGRGRGSGSGIADD